MGILQGWESKEEILDFLHLLFRLPLYIVNAANRGPQVDKAWPLNGKDANSKRICFLRSLPPTPESTLGSPWVRHHMFCGELEAMCRAFL